MVSPLHRHSESESERETSLEIKEREIAIVEIDIDIEKPEWTSGHETRYWWPASNEIQK